MDIPSFGRLHCCLPIPISWVQKGSVFVLFGSIRRNQSVRRRDRVPSVMAEGFRLGLEVIAFVEAFSSVAHGLDKTSVLIAFPQCVRRSHSGQTESRAGCSLASERWSRTRS